MNCDWNNAELTFVWTTTKINCDSNNTELTTKINYDSNNVELTFVIHTKINYDSHNAELTFVWIVIYFCLKDNTLLSSCHWSLPTRDS